MKFLAFLATACMMSACVSQLPYSQNRRLHPQYTELDDLEMMLLNDHESIYDNTRKPTREIASSTAANIRLGMARRNVKMSLGSPTSVEVAGNPKYGNERWIYETSIPTLDGYYTEKKIIYFEGGSVVGWESH